MTPTRRLLTRMEFAQRRVAVERAWFKEQLAHLDNELSEQELVELRRYLPKEADEESEDPR